MFIRRIFYKKNTGEVLYHYSMSTLPAEIEPAILSIEDCLPDENPEDIEIMEWTEIDESIETKFNEGCRVIVDISTIPHQLIFTNPIDLTPEEDRPIDVGDCIQVFNDLGIVKKEDLSE